MKLKKKYCFECLKKKGKHCNSSPTSHVIYKNAGSNIYNKIASIAQNEGIDGFLFKCDNNSIAFKLYDSYAFRKSIKSFDVMKLPKKNCS